METGLPKGYRNGLGIGGFIFQRHWKRKKKLIDIGLRWDSKDIEQVSGRLSRTLDGFMRLLILVNQLETKVHVDNYVDKSRYALFFLYSIYCHYSKSTS
jgi:hypothetical protein